MRHYDVLVAGCSHPERDVVEGRSSWLRIMGNAYRSGYQPKVFLNLGDISNDENPPELSHQNERARISNELSPFANISYIVNGNHDAGDGNMDFYLDCIEGHFTSNKPFSVNGTWDQYKVTIGNVDFLGIADRNDLPYPWGRAGSPVMGGHPSGTITEAMYTWLDSEIGASPNPIVFHHHAPRNTVIASTDGTGQDGVGNEWHGPSGYPVGRGSLYSIYDQNTGTAEDGTSRFTDVMNQPCLWCASHTHANLFEVDTAGKTPFEVVNDTPYMRVGYLTNHHAASLTDQPYYYIMRFYEGLTSFDAIPIDSNSGVPQDEYLRCMELKESFVMPADPTPQLKGILSTSFSDYNTWNSRGVFNVSPTQLTANVSSGLSNTTWGVDKLISDQYVESGTAIIQATFEFDGEQPSAFGLMGDRFLGRFHSNGVIQIFRTPLRQVEGKIFEIAVPFNSRDILRVRSDFNGLFFDKWDGSSWQTLFKRKTDLGVHKKAFFEVRKTSSASSTSSFSDPYFSSINYSGATP